MSKEIQNKMTGIGSSTTKSVEELFTERIREIVIPWRKQRAEFLGELLFKAQTEMGLPLDMAKKVIFEQEKKNREELVKQIEEGLNGRQNINNW